jgi:hypothetical protein
MFPQLTSPSCCTARGTARRIACVLTLALAAACSSEPTSPDTRTEPASVAKTAFLLTIDVATGRVAVGRPQQASQSSAGPADRPSFSLIGSDAISLHAGNCTFSSIPNNSKLKSCSMTLSIENRLASTDLVAPTSFPRPPAGVSGILVFPYTAAGLGIPGGSAVPNALWDGAPANFFNDFSGCASGKTSDCYRWESYAGPLNAGQTSATRTVGFDVDKNANTVAAYIVVAADLRDNPVQTLTILPEPENCSYHESGDPTLRLNPEILRVGGIVRYRSVCSFSLQGVPAGVDILSADFRVFQIEGSLGTAGDPQVIIDHVDYGTLETGDFTPYFEPALDEGIGTLPIANGPAFETLDVAPEVNADLTASRARFQLRLRTSEVIGAGFAHYAGPGSDVPPQITITYRKP